MAKATKRVLLVEDHDDARKGLTILLRQRGMEVAAYRTAEDAALGMSEIGPDIALLDVRLPGRSGDDFARELAARHPNTLIVFLTAEFDIEPLKFAVPSSVVLQKPVDFDALRKLISCL